MNSTTNTVIHMNAMITTRDDFEVDQRLVIDEDDKNNNDNSKLFISSGNSTRSNSPLNVTRSSPMLKIKSKNQLENRNDKDEKLRSILSGFSGDSQLRRALEKGPQKEMPLICSSTSIPSTSTTISLSSTPLLAASLSRPPVASPSSSIATLASASVAASATSSTINTNSSAVDLSQRTNKKSQSSGGSSLTAPITNNSNDSNHSALYEHLSLIKDNHKGPLRSPSEVYANLLMQLRHAQARINNGSRSISPLAVVHQVQEQIVQDSNHLSSNGSFEPSNSHLTINNYSKLTAAARKEKLRLQTSFQCPVCKKRFQRHIALNAHFQNEHIGSTVSEKHCKLCTHVCPDIATIRCHLLAQHCIDLDSPSSFLVEGEPVIAEQPSTTKESSSSSPPSPSSSSSPTHSSKNTENVDNCYKSNRSTRGKLKAKHIKQSSAQQENINMLKDSSSSNPTVQKDAVRVLPDTLSYDESSSSSIASNASSCTLSAVDAITSSSIQSLSNGNTSVDNKAPTDFVKQEPNENPSCFYNRQTSHYEEATDLSIKKVPQENRPLTLIKRASPSSLKGILSGDADMKSPIKKQKLESNDLEGKITKSLTNSSEDSKVSNVVDEFVFQLKCQHCSILFPNQTLYFLHRGFHSEGSNPWRCNGCGRCCTDMYDFNTHLMSDSHN